MEERFPDDSHFVLMTDSGVVLASSIASRFHKVHDAFPPLKPSRFSTIAGSDTEEIIGEGDEDTLVYIARNYVHQRLDEYDASINRNEVEIATRIFRDQLVQLVASNPKALEEIEWRDLERLLATALEGVGFSVNPGLTRNAISCVNVGAQSRLRLSKCATLCHTAILAYSGVMSSRHGSWQRFLPSPRRASRAIDR